MDKVINNNFEKLNTHKCPVCGLGDIESEYDICEYCGWEADNLQVNQPDLMGGANEMSLNQYKQFWEENKKEILAASDCLKTALDLANKWCVYLRK